MRKSEEILPFVYDDAETWDSKVDERVEIALEPANKTGTRIKFKDVFYVFTGRETGEKLIHWFKNYNDKILKRHGISWDEKIVVLRRLVDKEAEKILERVLDGTAPTNVAQYKWEYNIGKNKMEELRNNTADFSQAMKRDDSVERKRRRNLRFP